MDSTKRPEPKPSALVERLAAQPGKRRSAIYGFMRKNHDALAASFSEFEPTWAFVAEGIAELGLRGNDGSSIATGEAVRCVWRRVRRDVAAARAKRAGTPKPVLELDEIAPGIRRAKAPTPDLWPGLGRPLKTVTLGPPPALPGQTDGGVRGASAEPLDRRRMPKPAEKG